VFDYIKQEPGFKLYAQGRNARQQKIFALIMSIICILLLIDNEVPVFPLHFEENLTYYNISLAFSSAFFINWVLVLISNNYSKGQQFTSWLNIITTFGFIHTISYLEIINGNGLTALALGTITIAVVVSSNYLTLSMFIVANNLCLYMRINQLVEVEVSTYKMSIFALTTLGIIVFITIENQRRRMYETQKKLSAKVEELNSALDVKSLFFGHMSHELRTPLNAILGFSEMILYDAYQPKTHEKVKEYVGHIHSGGKHLLNIVNDILDSSKLEAGEVEAKFEKLNLNSTIESYINELGSITIDKKQSVQLVISNENIMLHTDRRLLKQIIFNLISNAHKFTSVGGLIEVLVKENGPEWIDIIVKDNGKGMDLEQLNAIKGEEKATDSHFIAGAEGTGLGIIIVKQLVKLLSGKIKFLSSPGVGTEIIISLPA
jgi:signal transduction histidine kinase